MKKFLMLARRARCRIHAIEDECGELMSKKYKKRFLRAFIFG